MARVFYLLLNFLFVLFLSLAMNNCVTDSALFVDGPNIEIHFNDSMHTKVIAKFASQRIALNDFCPSEFVTIDSSSVLDFDLYDQRLNQIEDSIGSGRCYIFIGKCLRLEKRVTVQIYDDFPAMAFFKVQYTNIDTSNLEIKSWTNHHYLFKAKSSQKDTPPFWSYMGASYGWENDWIRPLTEGFKRKNFMGMNSVDYGGGTPVVDIWRPDVGLAIGHVEITPKLVSLPVSVSNDSTASIGLTYDSSIILEPGGHFSTFRTFITVHQGDHFRTLREYSSFMQRQGLQFKDPPQGAYEPIWCGWGYEKDFSVEQITNTLDKVKKLGIDWVVLDYGWSTGVGDYEISDRKFTDGITGMQKLIDDIHASGAKAKLWWAPLTVHPDTKLYGDHQEYLLLNKDGSKRSLEFWESYFLCPAAENVRKYTQELVVKMMKTWGWDGLKIDGNHLNGVPPCYNPAHNHAYPEESVESVPEFFKMIYQTALSINPEAVIEICPCGQTYSFFNLPYMNQSVASDPVSSWQIRLKGKTLKALTGPKVVYYGDHVELSDEGRDFASTLGIGGVVGTKFVWPPGVHMNTESGDVSLTPEREKEWQKWIKIYKEKMLSKGIYRGDLYDIGYDRPETHVVQKGDTLYYAFYADKFNGLLEMRGLNPQEYKVIDYINHEDLGSVSGPLARLKVSFKKYLLIETIVQ